MTDIIERSLFRTLRHLQSEVQTKSTRLREIFDQLASEFDRSHSPAFHPSVHLPLCDNVAGHFVSASENGPKPATVKRAFTLRNTRIIRG